MAFTQPDSPYQVPDSAISALPLLEETLSELRTKAPHDCIPTIDTAIKRLAALHEVVSQAFDALTTIPEAHAVACLLDETL